MSSQMLELVISGGQTGADQAALFAAKECHIKTGGTAPKGYITLDGAAPWLKEYNLKESSSRNYVTRSIDNVDQSDATLAFRNRSSLGTDKTIGYALTKKWQIVDLNKVESSYKPIYIVKDVLSDDEVKHVIDFIRKHNVRVLNVCGHREVDKISKTWTLNVKSFLIDVFKNN